ncbi:unnamed protein product [Blepharisma stoltei]|uniref:TPX2 central domain-containing protein n=1 Tax=Blepharisma stoltei TaxID=1481888 RepID=A0AAU9KAS0_9CILI|nr:unnamed protein product [Blepharisma stoltei]
MNTKDLEAKCLIDLTLESEKAGEWDQTNFAIEENLESKISSWNGQSPRTPKITHIKDREASTQLHGFSMHIENFKELTPKSRTPTISLSKKIVYEKAPIFPFKIPYKSQTPKPKIEFIKFKISNKDKQAFYFRSPLKWSEKIKTDKTMTRPKSTFRGIDQLLEMINSPKSSTLPFYKPTKSTFMKPSTSTMKKITSPRIQLTASHFQSRKTKSNDPSSRFSNQNNFDISRISKKKRRFSNLNSLNMKVSESLK